MSWNISIVKTLFKLKYRIFIEWALCFALQVFELVPIFGEIFPIVVKFPMIFIGTAPARNSVENGVEVDITSSAFLNPSNIVFATIL